MTLKSVLVVDDDEGDQFLTQRAIRKFDDSIVIHAAYDGEEALSLVRDQGLRLDAIFLDINMPGMGGLEFLQHYSQYDSATSVVVMLTTSDNDRDRNICGQYTCAKHYVLKPLLAETLANLNFRD